MSDDNVISMPRAKAPDFIIGPFEEYPIVLEGKLIPKFTARREGDNIGLFVDNRFSISVPADRAYDVAWLIAHAMAIGAGYPSFQADSKETAFARNCSELGGLPKS